MNKTFVTDMKTLGGHFRWQIDNSNHLQLMLINNIQNYKINKRTWNDGAYYYQFIFYQRHTIIILFFIFNSIYST